MTLEELDNALIKLGLDIESEQGKISRRDILILYGRDVIQSQEHRCSCCWMKENRGCLESCELYGLSSDPYEVAITMLTKFSNDINLVSFIGLYVIPIYERDTGDKNMLEKIAKDINRKMKLIKQYKEQHKK